VGRHEVSQDLAEVELAEVQRGRHAQCAAGLGLNATDLGLEFVDVLEERPGPLKEELAGLGRDDLASGAVQELDPQPLLEAADVLAHGRRRETQGPRRAGEAAIGRHRHKGLHLVESGHVLSV